MGHEPKVYVVDDDPLDVHFTSTSAAAIGVGKSGGLWQDGESLA